jgi:hypothetical protein
MTQLINPKAEVTVYGQETFTIPNDAEIDVKITKDLTSEPNEAEVIISNLKQETQDRFQNAADQAMPIEIYLTPIGSEELVLAFKGEIDEVSTETDPDIPGTETSIFCSSQKQQTRDAYIDSKTYSAGTSRSQIIQDFIDALGVPIGIVEDIEDVGGILISESFTGPAFPLLQQYVFDLGMYCYMLDGKLYVTSVAQPESPTVRSITEAYNISRPKKTKRNDDLIVEMKTIAEASGLPVFKGKRSRKKKKKKYTKVVGANDYVDYNTVDKTVNGVRFHYFLIPDLEPDEVIDMPGYEFLGDKKYHVQEIEITANNQQGPWEMMVETDDYDESGGDIDADVESI